MPWLWKTKDPLGMTSWLTCSASSVLKSPEKHPKAVFTSSPAARPTCFAKIARIKFSTAQFAKKALLSKDLGGTVWLKGWPLQRLSSKGPRMLSDQVGRLNAWFDDWYLCVSVGGGCCRYVRIIIVRKLGALRSEPKAWCKYFPRIAICQLKHDFATEHLTFPNTLVSFCQVSQMLWHLKTV